MKYKNLTDELLIAFLEGNLSDSEKKEVQDLINQSDANFVWYSRFYTSYKQMHETEFEVAPDQLIERANKEFGLGAKKEPIISGGGVRTGWKPVMMTPAQANVNADRAEDTGSQGFDFSKLLKWVTKPQTLAYATLAASVAILITTQDAMIESPEDGRRPVIVRSLKKTNIATSGLADNKIEGLNIFIQNDTIFVEQTFKFNRTLIVLSGGKKDILFKSDFTDMYESFQFPDLIKSDSVYIIIETLGEEVYKNIFYMND